MMGFLLALGSASALSLPEVEASLVAYATSFCSAEKVDVKWLGLGAALPGGPKASFHWLGSPCQSRPKLKLTVVENGVPVGVWHFRPALDVWINVPVAAESVSAGEAVTSEEGLVRIQDVQGDLAGDGVWVARVSLKKGEALTRRVLKIQPDSVKGSRVRIETRQGPLTVSADGRLMEDAFVGKSVRVLNLATKSTQKGRLVALNRVVLNEE
jgi:flagella basal body P-ring formation protein FlgA